MQEYVASRRNPNDFQRHLGLDAELNQLFGIKTDD